MSPAPHAAGRPARAKTRRVAARDVDPARQVAWRTLRAVSTQDAYANLTLPRLARQARLDRRDAAFATELAYGALRGRGSYDAVLAACIDRPLDQVDGAVLDALRLGAHQLLAMRVPAHAAVAATVDLVRADVGQAAAGFANAVLRRVSTQDLDRWLADLAPPAAADPDGHLAVTFSHPVWIVRALRDGLRRAGRDPAELADLLAADNARPPLTLVALPGLVTPEDLVGAGAALPVASMAPTAVVITGAPDDLPAVRSGLARVQDQGSQLVALALTRAPLVGPDTGRWLDLCAGPGGKSAVLAATLLQRRAAGLLPDDAQLIANEPAEHRAELVRTSVAGVLAAAAATTAAATTAATTAEPVVVRQDDGRLVGEQWPGRFDRVLVDAPCTGLGALRRRPEARWRRSPADLAGLAALQRDLLRAGLAAVRPGGVVAYVTCSPHLAETGLVVDDVLKRLPGAQRLDARGVVRAVIDADPADPADPTDLADPADRADLGPGPDVQLWPHVHGCDAMFLALVRRSAEEAPSGPASPALPVRSEAARSDARET